MQNFPKMRSQDIVVQELENEVLIYDLLINKAYCLNQTSAAVWQSCDGKTGVTEISRRLSLEFQKPIGEDLIWLAIDQLRKEDLFENNPEIQSPFGGLSRREIIRRIGLASLIALPAVSSLIAPTAAMAQSKCFNAGGAPSNTLVGICTAGVGQPPATLATCTATCQNAFSSSCASCSTFATPSGAIPDAFECRCAP